MRILLQFAFTRDFGICPSEISLYLLLHVYVSLYKIVDYAEHAKRVAYYISLGHIVHQDGYHGRYLGSS